MNRFHSITKNILKRKQSGFTMVEMLVVIALVGIISAVAIPALLNRSQDRAVKDAAEDLFQDLQRAKMLSIERSTNVTVSIDDPDTNQYTVSVINKVVELDGHGPDVSFTDSPQPSDAVVVFTPQGVCSTPGAFVLSNSDGSSIFRIRASAAGGLSKHRYVGGSWQRI